MVECFQLFDMRLGWLFGEKRDIEPFQVTICEWISCNDLCDLVRQADQDVCLKTVFRQNFFLDARANFFRTVFLAAEDEIPALYVGLYTGKADALEMVFKLGHPDEFLSAYVDSANECDVGVQELGRQ